MLATVEMRGIVTFSCRNSSGEYIGCARRAAASSTLRREQ
jgi:hypothetical protein